MSLDHFNEVLIPTTNGALHPKTELPSDTDLLLERDPGTLLSILAEYRRETPELAQAYEAGVLSTALHDAAYTKSSRSDELVSQIKASTVSRELMILLRIMTPAFADKARVDRWNSKNVQYSVVVSGNENEDRLELQERLDSSRLLVEQLLGSNISAGPVHWALLGGIVSTGRGMFRVMPVDAKRSSLGGIRVLFDFKNESVLFRLFKKILPENLFWKRDGVTDDKPFRISLEGVEAFNFITKLLSNSHPLDVMRPEILLLISFCLENFPDEFASSEYFQAYVDLMGPFYRKR